MAKTDNYVLEAMVTFDKVGVLVHELMVSELWSKKVFSNVRDQVVKRRNGSLRCYFVLYHQAILINLLEVILYHDYVAESAGDAILDLVDFCARQVVYLNSLPRNDDSKVETMEMMRKRIRDTNAKTELQHQADDIAFRVAVSSVSVLRYITEHVTKLPLSVMNRILDTHDIAVATIPLIENPPWTRRRVVERQDEDDKKRKKRTKKIWEKYGQEGKWTEVKPENLLQLTKHEGQAWLILYNLLCEGECRKIYQFTSHRKDSILRVRRYLNELLLDQLPVLSHVQRYLDELTIMEAPPAATSKSRFVLEQVGEDILKGKNIEEISKHALNVVFCDDEDDSVMKELASIYGSDAALSVFSASSGHDDDNVVKEEKTNEEREVKDLIGAIVKVELDDENDLLELQYVARDDVKVEDVKTSKGVFKRYRMSLLKAAPPVQSDSRLSLTVLDSTSLEVYVDESELDLPSSCCQNQDKTVIDTKSSEMILVDQSLPASKWSKVGSLEDGIVAQIKFERRHEVLPKYVTSEGVVRCYGFGDMYVSIRTGYTFAESSSSSSSSSSSDYGTTTTPSPPLPTTTTTTKGGEKKKAIHIHEEEEEDAKADTSIEIEIQ